MKSIFSRKLSELLSLDKSNTSALGIETWTNLSSKEFIELFSLSEKLDVTKELIFSGCSETTGEYINDLSLVWGSVVATTFSYKSLNLSVGGASAFSIVNSLIKQIDEQGAPKHLLILFPRIESRMAVPRDPLALNFLTEPNDNSFIHNVTGIGDSVPKYSRVPHNVEEIIPRTLVSYLNIKSILALEAFCRLAKINLIYSTWSSKTDAIISSANRGAKALGFNQPFPNYIESSYKDNFVNGGYASNSLPEKCHLDLANHPLYEQGKNDHMGVHAQLHIAEDFIKELTKRGYSASL